MAERPSSWRAFIGSPLHSSALRFGVAFFWLLYPAAAFASSGYEGTGCSGEGPLLVVEGELNPVAQSVDGAVVYNSPEWRLPVSPDRPDILTEARLQVSVEWSSDPSRPATLRWAFTFNDPKPFGLPFTFQALEFTPRWSSSPSDPRDPFPPSAKSAVLEDWSFGCAEPGRSIFPGGSWSGEESAPGFEEAPALGTPLPFRVVLWGSRS